MKNQIEITKITTEQNYIHYSLVDNTNFNLLKSKNVEAWIKFDNYEKFGFSLASVPLSVLAVPMSLYLFPVTFFYPVTIRVPVLDGELYQNFPAIYDAYSKIYGPFDTKIQGGGISTYSI